MKRFFRQLFHLIADNPLHSAIVITGTAVTVAFVMAVVMIYDFRTADIAPESDRGRMLYAASGRTQRANGTNVNNGMGRIAYEALFTDLDGVTDVTFGTWLFNLACSDVDGSHRKHYYVRYVADNWFSFFNYSFIEGRAFTTAQYDAAMSVAVLGRGTARRLLGTDDVVGREIIVDFKTVRIVGVIEDVSPVFATAYADVIMPFTLIGETVTDYTGGLHGWRRTAMKLADGYDADRVMAQIVARQKVLNSRGHEYEFYMDRLYDHVQYTFFRDSMLGARLVYGLLVMVLLVIPAIGLGGLINSQLQGRLGEFAIRKAYGATSRGILGRLFAETFVTTFIGALLGYAMACLLVWTGRDWLLGQNVGSMTLGAGLFVRPVIAFYVFLVCLALTTLSTVVPAWLALRKDIAVTLKGGE